MSLKYPFPFKTSSAHSEKISKKIDLNQFQKENLQNQLDDLTKQQQRLKAAVNIGAKSFESFIKARSEIVKNRIADLQARLKD